MSKPRRSSGGSVEFRSQPQMLGEDTVSPTSGSSPHQSLSVTWATSCEINEPDLKFIPMQNSAAETTTTTTAAAAGVVAAGAEGVAVAAAGGAGAVTQNDKGNRSAAQEEKPYELASNLTSPVDSTADFPLQRPLVEANENKNDNNNGEENDNENDEEDYSISVSAIMQRRASIRGYRNKRGSRNSRRASSPMDNVMDSVERRRSSIYTTSSDEGTNQESTQEQIFENIRLHKEVIQSVKLQPWPMRKKLKLVRQAKMYVARHEGALQERFAMSRSTKDLWARFKILMAARWRHYKRETASFLTVLIPWELRIKEIESHFGSGVASYFTFLRWLMWVNIVIAIPLVAFVIGPEYFATKHDETDRRKRMSEHEFKVAGNLFTIWEFEGYLKYSPMFYGYYSSFSGASSLGYKLPLAYFLTAVVVYIYSFVATLRKMAENSRNSKLSSKDDECTFSWKLFTGWDFMIGHAETAHNRIASVVVGFKEALLEEAEKKKDNRNWRIILQRILVNVLVMGLLAASGYTVVALVNNAEELARHDNWLSRNAVNVTMTLLSFFLPMIFEALGLFENWHPRQQLRLQLARIMILNMLNLYSLMFSFIYKINSKEKPLQELKLKNDTVTLEFATLTSIIESMKVATTTLGYELFSTTTPTEEGFSLSTASASGVYDNISSTTEVLLTSTATAVTAIYSSVSRLKCYNITVKCSKPTRVSNHNIATTLLLINLSTTMLPFTTQPAASTTPLLTAWPTTTLATTSEETSTSAWTTTSEDLPTTLELTTPAPLPPETTTEAYTTTDYIDTTEIASPTPPQSTSTSTASPGNDSFFEYYDYFVGMPIGLDDEEEAIVAAEPPLTSRIAHNAAPQKSFTKNVRRLNRKSRQIDEASLQLLRKSKYSRRRNEAAGRVTTKGTGPEESPAVDADYTSTTAPHTTAFSTSTADDISSPRRQGVSPDLDTESANDSLNEQSTPASTLWVSNEKLQKVLAYFTTSTRSTDPTASTTEAVTAATMAGDSSSSTQNGITGNYYEPNTTPFFIDDGDIEQIGEPNYYDSGEIDDDNFEYCVRTICEELPGDFYTSTTEMDATTQRNDVAASALTPLEQYQVRLNEVKIIMNEVEKNLTNMCWETSLGQELSKVIVFDGIMSIVAPLCIDFLRALFVRYVNSNWCWDMEKTFPQYGDFKIAENILTLINNQGQVWMGIFFSPGLVLVNLVKLIIMMYFRSWIVLTCNVPHEVVFKASKSNNFYLSLLLTMLFLCVLPVGYAIVWLRPSWHCGPFSDYNRISEFITNTTRNALPKQLHEPLDYLTSSSTVIPLLLLLILIIYYLVSLTGALREANQDLRTQLQKEREEERKKIFKVPETKPAEPSAATLTNRWRKVLEASSPVTPTQPPDFETEEYKNQARKELISRIMKKALRKSSATSDEDSVVRHGRDDDDTDTEHHDSLPLDEEGKEKRFGLTKLQQIRRTRKPSLVDIVQIAKSERERERTAAMGTATAEGKPAISRGRFTLEKLDKKEKHEPKQSPADTDNDPEINSRIVNERRQSLMRRKREEDAEKLMENATNVSDQQPERRAERAQQQPHPTLPPRDYQPQINPSSNFEVIDEKKSPAMEQYHQHQPQTFSQSDGGKAKFKKHKTKSPNYATEPEVFKFDQKTVEKANQASVKLGKPVDIPTVPVAPHANEESHPHKPSSSAVSTPADTPPAMHKHANTDKLASFSRQGRKKIGSLLALVREAVNTKKTDDEVQSSSPGPDTPPVSGGYNSGNNNNNSHSTAIEIPTTPAAVVHPLAAPPLKAAADTSPPKATKSPYTFAPLEDPEELDQPRPITFPMRSVSQRRRTVERPMPMRQDSQTSIWSDNIPTITISTTGSEECILEPPLQQPPTTSSPTVAAETPTTSPAPVVKIIKINIEDEK